MDLVWAGPQMDTGIELPYTVPGVRFPNEWPEILRDILPWVGCTIAASRQEPDQLHPISRN